MEKKIYDFYQTAVVNDMQCVAYAYRPINTANNARIPFLNRPQGTSLDESGSVFAVIPPSSSAATEEETEAMEKDEVEVSGKRRRRRESRSAESEHDFLFSEETKMETEEKEGENGDTGEGIKESKRRIAEDEEERFYREVVKGQIFLGMATLCHRPKLNVVDFIEDLGLAGIRFVYFSPTAERESKAYAERLGLATDWNSCILLSSADSDNCGTGYLQSHDIKARLPRGIDKIRPHLENVDDIPLHVSLFAECAPEATREMIKIFQEYGEVVCCIGGALNAKNTASFALADVSIAMEPMRTRAQFKGRLNLSGVLPIGASLVSLPCGLFMQRAEDGELGFCVFCWFLHVYLVDATDILLPAPATHPVGVPNPVARVDYMPDFGVIDAVFAAAREYNVDHAW
ncbi:hypothetical protein BC937DRAFT_89257 [Endogone sp. FLAS-F59071]|nr:hypothetical protein BC937DRAFT_89257 [Endogone sp. FLAS-F59071]|eukprot:RUS17996.1 hypothetical protein BC937DRAFT_89257 [Endogone sp. FLAS-F59071]